MRFWLCPIMYREKVLRHLLFLMEKSRHLAAFFEGGIESRAGKALNGIFVIGEPQAMKQRDYKNRRKTCGSRCLIDKYSITHLNIPEIFGHGNLHILNSHIKFLKFHIKRK